MFKIGFITLTLISTLLINVAIAELVTGKCEAHSDFVQVLKEWKTRNLSPNSVEKSPDLAERDAALYGAIIYCGSNDGKLVYSYTFSESSPRRALEKCSRGLITLMSPNRVFSAPKLKVINKDQLLFELL
jgi:hypothetical protein